MLLLSGQNIYARRFIRMEYQMFGMTVLPMENSIH